MNTATPSPQADIHVAELALRDVLAGEIREEARDVANSLDRMLVHVVNMKSAVESTPASHTNVAKRLKDFSVTTARLAAKHPKSAVKLERLSEAFRDAGAQVFKAASAGEQGQRADAA